MKILRPSILAALILGSIAGSAPLHRASAAPSSVGSQSTIQLTFEGTGGFAVPSASAQAAPAAAGPEYLKVPEVPRPFARSTITPPPVPKAPTLAVTGPDEGFFGFNSISHYDQRNAGTRQYAGTQFSVEPPDQGLCAGNGSVIAAVNDALQVYNSAGVASTGVTALNQFFHLYPQIIRGTYTLYGQSTTDPRCYFDSASGRWFLSLLEIDLVPTTGAYGTTSRVELAVSTSPDPTGSWNLYSFETTNNTGTADHTGCPCFGDQPLIGADANGFYVSTNEYPLTLNGFNGAQIYAMSKAALASGQTSVSALHISNIPLAEGPGYTIQPATAPAAQYESAAGGTEYFLSALDFNGTTDNRIAAWALTNTSSLATTPAVTLSNVVISSEPYGQPPNADQKPGPTPLGQALGEPLEQVASNDDRMNQVVFAHGDLWSGVNTIVGQPDGHNRVGIAYFMVKPSVAGNGTLSASMDSQGYVAVKGDNVLFPSIGANAAGQGIMSFTVVGPDYFPSTAYLRLHAGGRVHIAGAGVAPEDGFSGYTAYGGFGVARWGDYSAAVADTDGTIWLAAEYIPNGPRTLLANWGTFITHLTPR